MTEEPFDEEKYYPHSEAFHRPEITVRYWIDFAVHYGYADYVQRFRERAAKESLAPAHRPKLSAEQFEELRIKFRESIEQRKDDNIIRTSKFHRQLQRLLLDEDDTSECIDNHGAGY